MGQRESHDSPEKKIARLMTWWDIEKLITDFTKQQYLVLAGKEAGDVSVLLGLGVPLDQITSVDWDSAAVTEARKKFPGLRVAKQDVEHLHPELAFACAFLDFCGYVTPANLDSTITATMNCVRDGGILACNFEVGREAELRAKLAGLRDEYKEAIYEMPPAAHTRWEGMETYLARADLIQNELWRRGLKKGCLIMPKEFVFYQGKTETWKGQPYCTYIATVRRVGAKKAMEWAGRTMPRPKFHNYEGDLITLRDYALDLARGGERADLLLNVTTSTIAAWKAHATRGTYKK